VAPGNSKKGKTQTINGTQTETGNETIGTIDRVFTGQDRYSLLKSFNLASDNGSNGPGLVDFSLYGAAYVVRETGGEPGASATGAGGSGVVSSWPSSDEDLATRVAQSLKLSSSQAQYLQDGGLTQTQTGNVKSGAASQEAYAQLGQDLYMQACFAAGTPIVMWNGWKLIEQIVKGDRVLSRSDLDPDGPLEVKTVEEVFERMAPVAHLHVRGQVIRTTRLHRFFLEGKGWTPYSVLRVGDRIRLQEDWAVVEDLCDAGETVEVYNFRVADYHTYFVAGDDWGFSVWAHNTYDVPGGGHFLEWELLGPEGHQVANGNEISGVEFALQPGTYLTFEQQAEFGHTEGKVIEELRDAGKLAPGQTLIFEGILPPCPGCQNIMKQT
jgi:hypothetical protein